MEPEDGWQQAGRHRAARAVAVMGASMLVLAAGTFQYLHPISPPRPSATASPFASPNRLVAVDFVNPSTGWVLLEGVRDFVILRTKDAGRAWSRQLAGDSGAQGEYVRFFDTSNGVLVVLGAQPVMLRTEDGGLTWIRHDLGQQGGLLLSATFTSSRQGWLLAVSPAKGGRAELLTTDDGGTSWSSLGRPVLPQDAALRVVFTDARHGWLYSMSAGPYAYTSSDGGASWQRSALVAPSEGWFGPLRKGQSPDRFLVAARFTRGTGVMATVIAMASTSDHHPGDWESGGYAILPVRAYDAGGSVTWIYPSFGDPSPFRFVAYDSAGEPVQLNGYRLSNQFQLTSADQGRTWSTMSPPSTVGAIGYVDELNWWWIGSGRWSTTADGGRTWTRARSIGVPEPLPGSLQILDGSHAWFGSMAGGRPLLERTNDAGIHWNAYPLPTP